MVICPVCKEVMLTGEMFCQNCGHTLAPLPRSGPLPVYRRIIRDRKSLETTADPIVPIGYAEDGIALALQVTRSQDLTTMTRNLASSLGAAHPVSSELESQITAIERSLRRLWIERGIIRLPRPNGDEAICYVTQKNIGALLSPSLLELLIPAPQLPLGDSYAGEKAISTSTQRLAASRHGDVTQGPVATAGKERFLALALEEDQAYVVGRSGDSQSDALSYQREFFLESLMVFGDCRYSLLSINRAVSPPQSLPVAAGNVEDLPMVLQRYFATKTDEPNTLYYESHFVVPRASILRMIVKLAYHLEGYHRVGKVHGDLKPANVLLTLGGIRLIDELGLRIGAISPAVSPVWGAPEQLTTRPVMCSTDIYPIGVMLVSLMEGQITGEMTNYAIPSSRRMSRAVTVIRDPMIYLELGNQIVPPEGMTDWLDFVERCLRFDPVMRFASGAECARALEALVAKYPLKGEISFELKHRGMIESAVSSDDFQGPWRIIPDGAYR